MDTKEVKMIWSCSFYDGPINGVCLDLKNKEVLWFEMLEDRNWDGYDISRDNDDDYYFDPEPRIYGLHYMDNETFRDQIESHLLFEALVGIHTCNHASIDGVREIGTGVRPTNNMWAEFYDWREGKEFAGKFKNLDPFAIAKFI